MGETKYPAIERTLAIFETTRRPHPSGRHPSNLGLSSTVVATPIQSCGYERILTDTTMKPGLYSLGESILLDTVPYRKKGNKSNAPLADEKENWKLN
jgi:hypothetical protein